MICLSYVDYWSQGLYYEPAKCAPPLVAVGIEYIVSFRPLKFYILPQFVLQNNWLLIIMNQKNIINGITRIR